MRESELASIIEGQREQLSDNKSFTRELLSEIDYPLNNFATIISGIRRCGKSTLLKQIIDKNTEDCIFLNFDTPHLYNFQIKDFALLDNIIKKQRIKNLFFDEIQVINAWEVYIRSKLDEGFNITITGSNASMLSSELGTRLTGRHISKELFPFSYKEFCKFKSLESNAENLEKYLTIGGFPQYVITENNEILNALLEDILYRDIVVRFAIKDVYSLRNLLMYLIANVGNLVSANKLSQITSTKTSKTILDYFSLFEQTYLLSFVPKFTYSYKAQIVNPKKVYCIDNGFQYVLSPSAMKDNGRRLENFVFNELRRKSKEIFYFSSNSKECDFVVCEKNLPKKLYQVCYELNNDNEEREINGLINAMNELKTDNGVILTFNQFDTISYKDKTIEVLPVWNYFK